MNVVLIGGAGFLGTRFCELHGGRHDLTVISKYHNKFVPELSGIKYHYEDWRYFNYEELIKNCNFDKVILFGWSGHPRVSNENIFLHFSNNVQPVLSVVDAFISKTDADIYFISSYGALPEINDSFSRQKISGYAASKLSVEAHLEAYSKIHNRNAQVFRVSNPFGRHQDFEGTQGVISIFIAKALRSEKIDLYDDLTTSKDYIYVDDAVDVIAEKVFSFECSPQFLVPVISNEMFSLLDIISHINTYIPIIQCISDKYHGHVEESTRLIRARLAVSPKHKNFNHRIGELIKWVRSCL